MRRTFLSGCGAVLAGLASSGCAALFQEADASKPLSTVYGAPLAEGERIVVVRIPAGTRGPVLVTVACENRAAVVYKASPYDDEPPAIAYKPSPYEDDAPVPLPIRPSPYKDVRLP